MKLTETVKKQILDILDSKEFMSDLYEGLDEKFKDSNWSPDFGEAKKHNTAGAIAIGARRPLIAYNINLDTENIEIDAKMIDNPNAFRSSRNQSVNGTVRKPLYDGW